MSRPFHRLVNIAGSGSSVVSQVVLPTGSGWVSAWLIREDLGGGASGVMPYLADHLKLLSSAAVPPDEYVLATESAGVTLTPSDTEASFRTAFVHPIEFQDGLRFVGDITASGSFSLVVAVWGQVK